ncbi:hypothetical protein ACROYT_G009417 [Oculina patagonica]
MRSFGCLFPESNNISRITWKNLLAKDVDAQFVSSEKSLPPRNIALQFKHRLAGRKYLPGSQGKGFPEFLASARQGFPYALRADSVSHVSVEKWAQLCREQLDKALPEYNAVLFRNLPLFEAGDFAKFTSRLGYKPTTYEGGTGNRYLAEGETEVYLSTSDPPDFNIELHNEMACSPVHPKKIMFFCLTEPNEEWGGVTPLVRNSEVFAQLDPEVVKKLEERQIRYTRYLPDEKNKPYASWQQSFMTNDRKKVEEFLQRQKFNYEWETDTGNLYYWYTLPPLATHPITGRKIWFTQPNVHHNTYYKESPMFDGVTLPDHMYPTHTQYGDGSEIDPEVIEHIRATGWRNAVGFPWRKRDVLVMDNLAVQHGRLSFKGDRLILAYLTAE